MKIIVVYISVCVCRYVVVIVVEVRGLLTRKGKKCLGNTVICIMGVVGGGIQHIYIHNIYIYHGNLTKTKNKKLNIFV